ncbi:MULTISPECIES: hypothetical protein [unclassified Luteimonas]
MNTLLNFLLVLGWLGMLVTAPIYFISLHSLRTSFIEFNDLLANKLRTRTGLGWAHGAYQAMQNVKGDELYGIKLPAEIVAMATKTRRRLYISMAWFLLTLAAGLSSSVLYGQA